MHLRRVLIRWLIYAVALLVAAWLVPGVQVSGWGAALAVALLFGLVNALVRPVVTVLSCPLLLVTLGLFTLVINALLFLLTAWLSSLFELGFTVAGFWPAFWGALAMSVVSLVLTWLVPDRPRQRRDQRG
jgi:putative membrane protein